MKSTESTITLDTIAQNTITLDENQRLKRGLIELLRAQIEKLNEARNVLKGDNWHDLELIELVTLMQTEVIELIEAITINQFDRVSGTANRENIIKECADIANFAAMIVEKLQD